LADSSAVEEGPTLVPLEHVTSIARAKLLRDRRLIKVPHHAACCRAGKHPAGGGEHDHKTQEEGPGPSQGPGPPQAGKAEKASTPDEPFQWPLGDHLTAEQKAQLEELLDEHRDISAFNMNEMAQIKDEVFTIPVTDDKPIFRRQYRLAEAEKEILKEQIEERLQAGFIRPSKSPWAAAVTMPPKKDEHGNWIGKRPCGDYRSVNRVSLTDHYQLPTPEEIFDALPRVPGLLPWTSGGATTR
jgi:hypothetical protein